MGGASSPNPPHPAWANLIMFSPQTVDVPKPNLLIARNLNSNAPNPILRLEWESQDATLYTLQVRENLDGQNWINLKKVTGTGEVLREDVVADQQIGFFRVVAANAEETP